VLQAGATSLSYIIKTKITQTEVVFMTRRSGQSHTNQPLNRFQLSTEYAVKNTSLSVKTCSNQHVDYHSEMEDVRTSLLHFNMWYKL
jgi:hypothetical protein